MSVLETFCPSDVRQALKRVDETAHQMLLGRSKFIAEDGYRIYSSKSKRLRPI